MAMEAVLKQLESRIEEMVKAFTAATARAEALELRVQELEGEAESKSALGERVTELEKQRDELAKRLQKVLSMIDDTLDAAE
ncbi:MAG: hypothetical protein ACC742_02990 [Thermoanaerobaculales bacterium]